MSRWVFFGRVLPERIPLRIGLPTPLGWSSEVKEIGLKYNAEFRCADGQIVAHATVTEGETDVHTLRNLVEQSIRAYVDAIGYVEGLNYDLDFISAASLETGEGTIFGIKIPVIAEARDPKKLGTISSDLLIAVISEPAAQIALADFREAMRVPAGTGFFCYRAIEAIMQSIRSSDAESDNVVWDRTRATLRIDRSAIDFVKKFADPPRHGKPSAISDQERAQVFKITDEVIRRFLEFLLRGKKTLSEEEFPTYRV
jgi:hypothetical protein